MAKEAREYVNPKRLLRLILKSLPAEEYVRSTVAALWMFCNDYIEKDDIANGTVSFSGTVSYSQLAEVLAIGESTAKWRMKVIRDEYQLVEWERTKFGVKFTFCVSLSGVSGRHKPDTEALRMPSTPAQRACARGTGHIWTDYLHTTQQCSACGKVRAKPFQWTEADAREAEYMAWLEEDAPDYFPDPLASYEAVDPPLSAAFLEYLEGSPTPFSAEERVS